jgi:predicted unusual protein kinase regulating ubiquinone biosynthesis (AarF/ABC1/UbiB family)
MARLGMSDKAPTTSSVGRFLRLSGLMGRVGASVLTERAIDIAMSSPSKQLRRTENLVKNATRIAETLGDMKGAAMKIGQMLSLHEGMLPPEVAAVLQVLQKEAPKVPTEVMRYEVEGALQGKIDELFADFDEEAHAAASIGQVHRATLKDGTAVAVKIQYPLIDEIVKADLKNMKRLLQGLFGMVFDVDFEPVWEEVRDRLLEEIDYTHEAQNMHQLAELHADVPDIVIPSVIDELSTKSVLTMRYLDGIPPNEAASDRYPQELKNQWGRVLLEFQLRGMFEHLVLHADPNLANFAFLEDGRVVVYDFGCVKRIPEHISLGYAGLLRAALEGRSDDVPDLLVTMGVFKKGEVALSSAVLDPYVDLVIDILREDPPYVFGEDEELYERILELGATNWSHSRDIQFPEDVIFIDRSLSGHFGNLIRFRAAGPWRQLVDRYTRPLVEDDTR